MKVNDRVVIQAPTGRRVYVVNGIGLDELTGRGDLWSPWVTPANSWLPSSVKAVVAAENPPHTTKTNDYTKNVCDVVPDHLSTTLELTTNLKHLGGNTLWNRPGMAMRHG